MTTESKTDQEATTGSGRLKRGVMFFREHIQKRRAKRLYRRLWKANEIILSERHSSLHEKHNKQFHSELEDCADQIEKSINVVRRVFKT
jgi:hypothetical protein